MGYPSLWIENQLIDRFVLFSHEIQENIYLSIKSRFTLYLHICSDSVSTALPSLVLVRAATMLLCLYDLDASSISFGSESSLIPRYRMPVRLKT